MFPTISQDLWVCGCFYPKDEDEDETEDGDGNGDGDGDKVSFESHLLILPQKVRTALCRFPYSKDLDVNSVSIRYKYLLMVQRTADQSLCLGGSRLLVSVARRNDAL